MSHITILLKLKYHLSELTIQNYSIYNFLDEDVYNPYPCLCASKDVFNLRSERCFNDPAIDCESCSRTVCGSWSQWSSWSSCSKTCGGGERSRERTFTWHDATTFVEVQSENCNTGNFQISPNRNNPKNRSVQKWHNLPHAVVT